MNEAIILILFGGVFLIVGAVSLIQTMQKRKKCSKVTSGIVKSVRTDNDEEMPTDESKKKGKSYRTTVEYKVNEETYLQDAETSSTMNMHYVGEKVEVHYSPQDPTKAYWGTDGFLGYFTGTIFSVVGVGLILVSLFIK